MFFEETALSTIDGGRSINSLYSTSTDGGGGVSTIATGTGLLTDWLAHCKFIECGIEEGGGKLG